MKYNDIYLHFDRVNQSVQNWINKKNLNTDDLLLTSNKDKVTEIITYKIKSLDMMLIIYLKDNGKVTVNYQVGKNKELSKELADYIINNSQITDIKDYQLSFKEINKEDVLKLSEVLINDGFSIEKKEITNQIKIDINKKYPIANFSVLRTEKCTLTFYEKTKNLLFQGKTGDLKIKLLELLGKLCNKEEIIKIQIEEFNIDKKDINVNKAICEIKEIMPNAFSFIGEDLQIILVPSISLKKIIFETTDYSYLIYPPLRALEGYIKKLFAKENILIQSGDNFKNVITKGKVSLTMKCLKTQNSIETAYNLYSKNRHPLFHADATPLTTKVYEDRQEAIKLIEDIYYIIEKTYTDCM